MTEAAVVVKNRAGLHARPAALIVQASSRFSANIELQSPTEIANAKSIMGVIALGAAYLCPITIRAEGKDEKEAVALLVSMFESKFEEE